MAVVTRRLEAAHELEAPLDIDSPKAVKAGLTADRLRDFHDKRRVLVVDDNRRAAERLGRDLGELYGKADVETDPYAALARIEEAVADGRPYDAVVLDLYMPGLSGVELMKRLAGKNVNIVVNTASMMSPAVADLKVQLDGYQTRGAKALLDDYEARKGELKQPVVPILTHFKFDGLGGLVDKIDTVMLIASGGGRDDRGFLESYDPLIVEPTYTAEAAHRVAEEAGNIVADVGGAIEYLKKEGGLADTPWWRREGGIIDGALGELRKVRFNNTLAETPELTGKRLHDILFHIQRLDGPAESELTEKNFGALAGNPMVRDRLTAWARTLKECREVVRGVREGFEQYHRGEFNPADYVRGKYGDTIGSVFVAGDEKELNGLSVPDAGRFVRGLIDDVIAVHKARGERHEGSFASAGAAYISEEHRRHEEPPERRRLDAIKAGGVFKVYFSDEDPAPFERDFERLLPAFAELERKGLGIWRASGGTGRKYFDLLIKTSEKSIDWEAEAAEKKRKKPDGTYHIVDGSYELKVHEELGERKDIVALDRLPTEKGGNRPMVYAWGGVTIYAAGTEHLNAAGKVATYIAHKLRERGEKPDVWETRYGAERVYRDGVRLRTIYGEFHMDCPEDSEKGRMAISALTQLGVERGDIDYDPHSAGGRLL